MSFLTDPIIALFLSLALGFLIGKLRVGPIQLGGTCGTLFVALAIGQFGVRVDPDLKNAAFALFIYALGFSAGPQFFTNIRGGWRYGIFSFIEVICVLVLLAIAVLLFHFDVGTASGLFAGAATESAVVGTASEAIARLAISTPEIEQLQANIATAYSLTYLFGLIAIVVFTTQIAPLLLKIDLRKEAQELARKLGSTDDDEEQAEGLPAFVGRAYRVGGAAGQTVGNFEKSRGWAIAIERLQRGSDILETTPDFLLEPDDIVFVRGRRNAVIAVRDRLGDEVPVPQGTNFTLATRDVVLVRKEVFGRQIRQLRQMASAELQRGIFISHVRRMGQNIPALSGTILQHGDIVTLYGPELAIERAAHELGKPVPPGERTDFIFLGLGLAIGLVIGHFHFKIGALELGLGAGGGALISGLVFGWLNMRNPMRGGLPPAAAEFAKEFGLATFIAAIGLSAGPDAIDLIMEYGLILPVLGVLVSFLPALVSLFVGTKLMKIEAPILLGIIAGQHCSTPTISALVSQAGNSTPVIGYTVTYAISNVLLPLMGPVVVGLVMALTG
ncbi:aspartate-alanine antiporter [Rhizobium sp. LjRoot98]|uniref:aspartate-alanine antiporter n=1 Tax=unclassified Rhizobium TaxID=2613769 RepID=UPI000729784A|nr:MULTISPECIES: aspartate-alanine antiporter [unclassified Rhizobium]KQY18338.1 aspartate-alanine antiporter [Rhizobium sp. Root1334]KRB98636.1 aspartate-alanine antiporter [Rhizobium sp. Root73]